MWPFKKKPTRSLQAEQIMFSQLDITEQFGDDQRLSENEWIETVPLNLRMENPTSMGLPSAGADNDAVYRVADNFSVFRESISIANDGVYCPVCHIANVDLGKLRTPCPKCSRPLLKFGWD